MNPTDNPIQTAATNGLASRIRMSGGRGRSLLVVACGCALLLVLAGYAHTCSKGVDIQLTASAPEVTLVVDGRLGVALQNGSMKLTGFPYGTRTFTATDADYLPVEQKQSVTWFTGSTVRLQLTPRPIEMRIQALPGSEVLVDQVSVGKAASNSQLIYGNLLPGEHLVSVRLDGYDTWEHRIQAHPPVVSLFIYQPMTARKMQQMQERYQRTNELVGRADQLYRARQYRPALAAANEALALDPQNTAIQQLKQRIEQTLNVLGN
jgi:hypothetical protein